MLYSICKRFFDFLSAWTILILCAPLLLILSIVIKLSMGGTVFFTQLRPGYNGKIFRMYKFRTMIPEDLEHPKSDEQRITALGRWLRATSLDELPELYNVIKGEMSLVGPRPLLVDYLEKYTPEQMRRHDVLPGITGLAQVRGRNELSWKSKFRYDIFYVDHSGCLFDLKILFETVAVVIYKKGFKSHGEARRFGE